MSASAEPLQSCPKCGVSLTPEAPKGLCPRCLFSQAMRPSPEEPVKPKKAAVPLPEEMASHFPNYEILRILGRGGMGAVYLARQTSLNRLVAIKILPAELDDGENNFTQRFKNEAQAMAQLSHPGIVAVYDFGQTTSGLLYIVMEYIDGTDVALMVERQGRLPSAHAMAITAHVCDALAYAHGKGIIHRDIKPSNIMIGYDGVVKVADFGLAKMSQTEQSGLTQSGMVMGTLHFMAPEVLMLGKAVDQRADIYAVGVMLYQMLTGKLPQGLFEMPSLQVKGLDPRYDGIVAKALREDRNLRYASAVELRHDLDAILTQPVARVEASAAEAPAALNTQARPRKPGEGADPRRQVPTAAAGSRADLHSQAGKKSSAALLWTLLLVAAVFGGAAWLVLHQPKERPDSVDEAPSAPVHVTAKEQQATRDAPFINTLGMKFVPVPGTKVLFCIHETRRQDYAAYANELKEVDGSWKTQQKDGIPCGDKDDHPVVGVSWEDSEKFCEWLSKKEGKTYRLPTDEEWSIAVGLGQKEKHGKGITPEMLNSKEKTEFPWGDSYPPKTGYKAGNYADDSWQDEKFSNSKWIAGYSDGFSTTAPVMSFKPNKAGLYDMGGNVWEWCEDWYSDARKERVLRGAAFNYWAEEPLLASFRYRRPPSDRDLYGLGFRCVLGVSAISTSSNPAGSAEMLNAPSVASQNQLSLGKTVDLLRLINPANDTVRGRWEWTPEGLKLLPKTAVSTIEFPYEPPEFFDFTIEFSVKEGKYRQVDQILTCQGVPTSWQMGAGYAPSGSFGLMMVDGVKAADTNRTEAVALRERLSPDVRHRSTVQVRKNRIRAILDGKEILNWEGDFNRLDLESQSRLKSVNRLGIGGFGTEAIFYLAELKAADESTAKATIVAPKLSEEMTLAAARGGRLRAWGNFYEWGGLRFIDVSKAAGYSDFVALAGDDGRLYALRKNQVMVALDSLDPRQSFYEKAEVQRLFRNRIWPHYQNDIFIIHKESVPELSMKPSVGPLRAVAASFYQGGYLCIPDTGKAFWLPANGNRKQDRPPPVDLIDNAVDAVGISCGICVVSREGRLHFWNFAEVIETSAEYSDIVEIQGGLNFALCRKRDGSVLVWPPASYKEGYLPDPGVQRVPTLPPAVQIRCGSDVCAAQMQDGRWIGWGEDAEVVAKISAVGKAVDIAIPGRHHSTMDHHGYVAWIEPLLTDQLPPELAALDTQFRALDKERVTVPYEVALAKLNNGYLASLQKAIATEKSAGRLDGISALESEQRVLSDGAAAKAPGPQSLVAASAVPETDDYKTPASLKALRVIYREQFARLVDDRAVNLKALTEPLDKRLAALESEMTKTDRVSDAKTVRAYRENLAKSASGGRSPGINITKDGFTNSLGMKFVSVPGTDVMFCIHETRRQDYAAYADTVPGVNDAWRIQQRNGIPCGDMNDHPVVGVTWGDAVNFCGWLGKKEGGIYRLPTDEEWSIAVGLGRLEKHGRGITMQMLENKLQPLFPWEGDYPPRSSSKAGNYADEVWREKFPSTKWIEGYRDGYATTAPVMSFKPNKQKLYDMGGNVWEWVQDWYNELEEERGLRGGSYTMAARNLLLASDRHATGNSAKDLSDIGFRLVFVPPAKP